MSSLGGRSAPTKGGFEFEEDDEEDVSRVPSGTGVSNRTSASSGLNPNAGANEEEEEAGAASDEEEDASDDEESFEEEEEEEGEDEEDDDEDEEDGSEDDDAEEEEGAFESATKPEEIAAKQEDARYAEYACCYCGISDPASVVRCLESGRWFCNGTGATSASHIVQHLVRSRNKELCLHPDSGLGETTVECFNCASRNVFMMGFLPKGDGVVVLLCRNCLGIGALKEMDWDADSWTPLVRDRSLVPWLVKVPSPEMQARARKVVANQIDRIETLWKTDPKATLDDLDRPENAAEDIPPARVQLAYDDGFHFQNIFGPLVQIEAEYDRASKESLTEENVSIKWTPPMAGDKWIACEIGFSTSATEAFRLTIGDELLISLSRRLLPPSWGSKADWEAKATVVRVGDPGASTTAEVRAISRAPIDCTEGYTVAYIWKPVTYDRMQNAMKKFAVEHTCMSNQLYHNLLGHNVADAHLNHDGSTTSFRPAPNLPPLNQSQQTAVQQVMNRPLALIQGPPGTGKTVVLATIVYGMVMASETNNKSQALPTGPSGSKSKAGKKKDNKSSGAGNDAKDVILVCAPSNVAVDHLVERIQQTGVKVVRVSAKSREHVDSAVERFTLHNLVQDVEEKLANAVSGGDPSSVKSRASRSKGSKNESKRKSDAARSQSKRIEAAILASADVICTTCAGAGDPRLMNMRFRRVLVDEATQATEPESLIPLVRGCEQFILVGDHCQLGPVVMSKRAAGAGLNTSLFERLVTLGLRPVRLQVQYRMHPCLSSWPSNTFYEGSLQNGVSAQERSAGNLDFPWIDRERPMMFMICNGFEEIASSGTSYLNRGEAQACERIVAQLLRGGVSNEDIGIITPYEGQRAYITQVLRNLGHFRANGDIEVSSVDAFQGREKDFIVLSCVRSNEKQGIGFLIDPRRLNVALTRAKRGLIILGNAKVLAKRSLWNDLIVHFKERGLLVEGPLNNLQISHARFASAKKFSRDLRQRTLDDATKYVFSGDVSDPYGDYAAAAANTGVPQSQATEALDSSATPNAGIDTSKMVAGLANFEYAFGSLLAYAGATQHLSQAVGGSGGVSATVAERDLHETMLQNASRVNDRGGPATQQSQHTSFSQTSTSSQFSTASSQQY